MTTADRLSTVLVTIMLAAVGLPGPAGGQELSAEAKENAVADARAKRNVLNFENNATTIVFYDRSGKRTGSLGERTLYEETVQSPDRSRVAIVKDDLANESADLFVLDGASGASTRLTTSARTEFVMTPVWSPDGVQIAYVTIRKGQEGIYARRANGEGPEELLYSHPGAFLNLTDWSLDGRFLTFAISDLSGGTLYTLPLAASGERKAVEIFHSDLRLFDPRLSPDGRFVSYGTTDKMNRTEVFVRPVDAGTPGGPWQISDGSTGSAFWRRDGRELYYVARDGAVTAAQVSTSPTFSFKKPSVLFRPEGRVPDRVAHVSADGERFLALPFPRGRQLQQLTIFNRQGQPVRTVGEPGVYAAPSFSPDASRLLVAQTDLQNGQSDLWTIDLATGKSTRLTNDAFPRGNAQWSPDGKDVFYASTRDGDRAVFRKRSDGSGSEELVFRYTPGAGLGLSDISPDGKFIVCDSGGVILVVPLTGDPASRKAIEFLREEFSDNVGRLSPDGQFMAFRSDEAQAERGEVYVRRFNASTKLPGEGKWQVSKDGANGMIQWRSDGKEIFFRGENLESNELLVMSVDVMTSPTFTAGTPKALFKVPGPVNGNLGNISRDGQRFVFAVNVPSAGTR